MTAVPVVVTATLALAAVVLAAAMAPVAELPTGAAASAGADVTARPEIAASAPAPVATGAPGASMSVSSVTSAAPPAGVHDLALTDDQRLIADHALRQVMDGYLSDRRNPQRLQQLDQHLRNRLPPAAAAEARALAARYDAYLAEHDALLIAQNFGAEPDLHRLASWQLQRRQLRERLLGTEVAEQWFGTEDAYLAQALEERHQPVVVPSLGLNQDQQLHAQHMRAVIAEAIGRAPP